VYHSGIEELNGANPSGVPYFLLLNFLGKPLGDRDTQPFGQQPVCRELPSFSPSRHAVCGGQLYSDETCSREGGGITSNSISWKPWQSLLPGGTMLLLMTCTPSGQAKGDAQETQASTCLQQQEVDFQRGQDAQRIASLPGRQGNVLQSTGGKMPRALRDAGTLPLALSVALEPDGACTA